MKAFHDMTNFAIGVGFVLMLPMFLGCGHESAASPVATSATSAAGKPLAADRSTVNPSSNSDSEVNSASGSDTTDAATSAAVEGPASSPAPPKGQRPPADRAPTRPGEAEKITFDDLNLGMQPDVVFRPLVYESDRVKELEGKRISIVGYMHGGQATQRGIKEFILLKNTQCKFGPGGQADHLANVLLRADSSTSFTPSPLKVEGTLKLEPFQGPDGNTWSIYRLEDAQIR